MFAISVSKLMKPMRFQQVCFYAKFVQKTKEELREEVEKKKLSFVRNTITSALKQRKCLSVPEWKTLGGELQKNIHFKSPNCAKRYVFDILLSLRPPNDSMQTAKNYIEAFDLPYDLNIKRNIIQLYAKKASEERLTDKEENELNDICSEFIDGEFLDFPEIHSSVTLGLCATKQWKRALDLKNPSVSSLNIIIRKILREREIDLVWDQMEKLTHLKDKFQQLARKTVVSFAKYFQAKPKEIPNSLDKLLTVCERIEKVFDEESARELAKVLQKSGHHAKITNIDHTGVCGACQTSLNPVQITSKQFELVRNAFANKVVNGDDIYQKTTPEEWQRFERTIHENGPFDIVMDGLNVSYLSNGRNVIGEPTGHRKHRPCAISLANVVQQLVKEGKRVLVIGRKHMSRWPRMSFIEQNATVFLVDDVTKDDIFILYATLWSGQNSYILSNDFMRQHKFAIGNKFNELFKQWQQEHWYGFQIGKTKPIELVKPMQFKMYCHKVNEYWHLPFKSNEEIESNTWSYYNLPKNWVCIRLKTKEQNIVGI